MAKIYDSASQVSVAQDLALSDAVNRSFARVFETLTQVQSTYATYQLNAPFPEGVIKRVVLFKEDDSNGTQYANLILSENAENSKLYKICEYSQIDFFQNYLDSQEEIYYSSNENKIYVHINVESNISTNFIIRLDIEKVN